MRCKMSELVTMLLALMAFCYVTGFLTAWLYRHNEQPAQPPYEDERTTAEHEAVARELLNGW